MTDILTSFWGRKKPKPATPERSASERVAADDFVVVNPATRPQSSMYPTSQSSNDYESLFSYLRVTEPQISSNGGIQPVRPAPLAPSSASALPYPLHRAAPFANESPSSSVPATAGATSYANAVAEQTSSAYYLNGIPFQLSKSFGDPNVLNQLNKEMHIKSPNLSEYEYSFAVEMEVIQESSPRTMSPTD